MLDGLYSAVYANQVIFFSLTLLPDTYVASWCRSTTRRGTLVLLPNHVHTVVSTCFPKTKLHLPRRTGGLLAIYLYKMVDINKWTGGQEGKSHPVLVK